MKLNLFLNLGIACSAFVGATPINSNATQKSTKVVIPWRIECPMDTSESPEQTNCSERNGFFMFGAPMDEEGNCDYKYACFLPTGTTKIFPNAILAKDPSECIKIRDEYYCSADLNNYDCPDCTFPQFVQKVYETFGERFEYEDIDLSEVTTPITVPTETSEKIKCATRKIYGTEGEICESRDGLFLNEAFYPDCDKKRYACFLPEGKKVTKNAVAAKNDTKCIAVNGKRYCSIDYTNISCPEGKENCTFIDLVQEISEIYGDYFTYEKSYKSSKSIRPTPSGRPNRPKVINFDFCKISNHDYEFYKPLQDCEKRDGKFIYGAPVDDDGNCVKMYACFLPEGTEDLGPEAMKAQDSSECISMNNERYCAADLNNFDCPDCTFTQFVEKVYVNLGEEKFSYEEDSSLSPSTTVTTTSTPTSQKSTKVVIPWRGECGLSTSESPEQTDCKGRDGFFMFGAPMDEEGNCDYKYACFLPTGATTILPNAILAKDPSECIKIKGSYYCSADLNNYDCPDCTFPQFVQKVYETFGERFDYEDIDLNEVTTPITVPTETTKNIKCATREIYGTEGRNCKNRNGLFLNEAFYPDCDKKRFACFLPEGKKITKNAVAAQDPSECIVIHGKTYCSIDYTNISCPEGKETCTFSELLQEISGIYGDYFSYEAPSNPPKTVTPTPSAHPNRPQVINTDFCSVSNYEYEFYSSLMDCEDRDGEFIYGAPVDDDGNCVKLYACFHPEGTENLLSEAIKAQNSSECIIMNGKRYCAADLNNFDCPDCTFTQFVEKVYVNLGEENFSYEEDSSLSPSTETVSSETITVTATAITTTTTTTPTIINTLPTKCVPVTVTEKVKETITVKETVTVTAQNASATVISESDKECAEKYAQCGGEGFKGPNCCKSGLKCHAYGKYYSQCV